MAKTLLEQYDEWKQKKQKEEQQASQPKYTIPDSGSILEQYQAYKQQRQANEQKALSSKRINNPSHLGNVMIAGAVQNTQKKQAEAARVAKEEEARRVKQEEKQSWNDYVQRLTDQYMPIRPDPIPQVDINKKYGPVSELTKRGATIASSSVSDAPFGFGKIIDLSGGGGSMSVRNSATEEADRERTEQAERDRKDQAARDGLDARIAKDQRARLEREHTAAPVGPLNAPEDAEREKQINQAIVWVADRKKAYQRLEEAGKRYGQGSPEWELAVKQVKGYDEAIADIKNKYKTGDDLEAALAEKESPQAAGGREGRIVSDKVALEGALETADRERAEFAQRDMQGTKEREAVLERNLSVEDLQAKRAAAEKDIEQYNKVLEWVPSPQNVEAYQNYLAAQTQKKAAQEGIEQIDTFILIKQLKDQASKETEPYELAYINSKLQAAEYKYKWSTMDPEERANTWVWQRVERGFRNYNRAYYGLTTDFIADILGIDRSEVSKQNQKQLDVINKEIAYQAQSTSKLQGVSGDILTMAVENFPNIAMSFMGGGGLGVAANAAMDLKTAAAPFVTKFLNSFTKMVKNPMFWNSFMRSAGNNYINEHDVKGNDPIISLTAASIKGFLDSTIEVGGGIETGEFKPLGPASIIQSGFEEMGEEFFQGPVASAYDFSQSGKGADTKLEDIVSWDNPNAIISGKQMAQEGIMGFAGGAALSGMQQAGVAAVGAVKGQDLSAEPRSEYNYPEANIDQQIADIEAEIAKKESEAYENAARERMDFETRDGEAAKQYAELVTLVNESFPEESETRAKIAEATTIDTKRMTEIATGAMQELRARMQAEASPEVLKLSEALTQTVEGIFAGMQTDRNAITDKYTAGLDEGLKAEIKGKNDADYAKGYGIAHALGQMGVPVDTIAKVKSVSTLQETAQEAAQQGQAKWEVALPQLKAKAADLQKALPKPGQGGVTYRANVKQEALSTLQRDQIGLLEKIAKPLGYNFVMMEFDKDAQGNYVTDKGQIAPNGFFRDSDGTIYIDVNAGKTVGRMVEDTIIPLTAGHELGHYLKATSPELFRAYSAAVVEELVSKGTDIDALIAKQIGRGKLREITVESALEEMIMESGAMILSNSQAAQKMAETNPGLFQKIAEWVKDFVDSIRKAFSRVDATPEAKAIMQTVNGALKYSDTIINLWDTMAVTEAKERADVKPATVARRDVQAVAKEAAAKKTAYTSDGQAVDYHYEIAPVGSLIPSNLETSLEPNPDYPQELQPRDRTRAASQQQVEEIANKLNPALLGESADVGTGAPFVGPDMVVESGNGRILAITRAMRQGKGLTYTQWLKDNAARFGVDPAKVDNASVLVRVRDTEVNRPEFVQKANESQVATYSDSESAVSDAKKVTPAMLEMANMDSGDINSAGNSSFVSSFISKVVPVAERGRMMDASGKLSKSGENRVRTALFQMAYEDGYLTEQMAEASDDTSKNILKAMTAVAPRLALMNDAMKKGTLSDYPIGQAIAEAYRIVQRQKRLGVSVDRYINQQSLVRQDTPAHWMLLEMFNENRNAPNRMTDALNSILNAAERQGNPNQMLMPGLEAERPSVEGIVRDGLNRYADEATAASERDTLKFQMREPVEETAKLIAVHNLSEAQLLSSVELGGFAMPSIAVIRAGQPHDRYGDISIVFGKETIDPENYGNKVYGGDAWTPSFPEIQYEIGYDEVDGIRKKVKAIVGDELYRMLNSPFDEDNLQQEANRNRGDFGEAFQRHPLLIAAYLKSIGEQANIVKSIPAFSNSFDNETVDLIDKKIGDRLVDAGMGGYDDLMALEPEVRKIINDNWSEKNVTDDTPEWRKTLYKNPFPYAKMDGLVAGIVKKRNWDGEAKVDRYETERELVKQISGDKEKSAYKSWVNDLLKGVIVNKGIRNNADTFTPSGNRRSFSATHWAVTLENVVRAMRSQEGKGSDSWGSSGLFGVSTKNYSSLDDIRKDIDRLQQMDEEQYQEKKDEFQNRIVELAGEIARPSERNRFIALDNAAEVLTEAARKGTAAGIQRVLNGYKDYYNIREDTAKKLYKLMSDISRMPTEYFEAKPERAVGFDEVRAVIIPDTASDALKKALDNVSAPVIEYKADDNADRLKALNSPELDGVKFQERDTQYLAAVESGDMAAAQKMVDEAAKAAGYTNKVFHGTDAKFTVFDTDEESTEREVHAWIADYADGTIFATTDKTGAGYYGQNVMPLYIKPEDVKRFKAKDGMSAAQAIDDIYGYEVFNYHVIAVKDDKHTIYATLDNTLLKSADPVTYDNSGNPIPLSQRFTDSNDIRFQERDSDNTPLSPEQIEYFKDSKVRDAKGRLMPVYHGTEKAGFHEFSESDDIGYFFTSSSRLASTYSGTYKDYAPARIDTWEQAKAYAEKNNIDFEENDDEYIIDGDTFVEEELKFAEDLLNELTAESSANYNAYLNLKDPYIIDAGGSNWSAVIEQSGTMKMFSELTKTEKKRISENMGLEVGEIYDITDDYGNSLSAFDVDNFYFNYPRTTREIVQEAVDMGADGVIIRDVEDGGKYSYGGDTGDVYVALNPEQIKSTANLTPTSSPDIRYQERDPVPAMYSKMAQEIEAYKGDKLGADSVVKYLQGRGVKADEIRWSGIVPFLQGKKSVSKAELIEFAKASALRVEDITYEGAVYNGTPTWNEETNRWDNMAYAAETRFEDYTLKDGSNYRELLYIAPDLPGAFQSSHWPEDKNVLAHTRLQDFQTTDGKPVLFVEEVQSDWHEKGREQGYKTTELIAKSEQEKAELVSERKEIIKKYNSEGNLLAAREKMSQRDRDRESAIAARLAQLVDVNYMPDEAPFATTWHEYVLKRVLRMAAEGGYDYVGWTTGQMQADRYSLEKVLSELTAIKRTDGTYFITAKGKDGQYLTEDRVSVTKLPSIVGKEMAHKIVGGDNIDTTFEAPAIKEWTTKQHFEGLDLKVGGEGMKAFYDIGGKSSQNIPRFLNKYGAQWGAKIQTIDMQGSENTYQVPAIEVTDAMKESVLYEGQPLYQERDPDYRTKRDILAGAFDSVAQTEGEKRNLKEYKNLIGSMNRMEEEARGLRQANTAERKKPERDKTVIESNTKRIAEIEERINNLDKRLLKMQNAAPLQNVLKREVDYYKKQQSALSRQQLEKYRADRAETSMKQRYRNDISKGVKTLNNTLMNESDQKHIPEGFKAAVIEFLKLFTDNTSVFDYKRLSVLKEMYDALVTSDSELAGMYDFDIAQDIADAARLLEGKRLSQLTETELESLRDIVAHFNHIVKNENQIFTQKRSVKTTDAAEEGLSEYGKKAKEMRLALLNGKNPIAAINKFLTSKNIKPVYFFKRVGGILQELFDDIRAAQGKWAFRMSEDRNFFRNTVQKYNYYKWADDGQLTFKTARGDQITLTRDQALELYAINKREKTNNQQGAEHLAVGGFVYEDAVKVKKKGALGVPMTYEVNVGENHPLADSDLDQIGKWLTNEQRAFADEMVNYLSTVMGERGNEVSLALYGIRKYVEKYYFPYKSASNYLYSHQGGAQDDSAIKHRSFTRRTTVSANNPVVLTGFTKVWADHVQNMNLYNAMAVPLDNFNRVYNYRIRGDKDATKAQSVKAALEAAYGKEANAYIKQLLNDVNGGIRPDKGDAEARKMMSLWKKGAVFASLSVVVQQPSAIGRALALVDPKYFRKGYTKAGYEEMMKWSGTANIKAMGRFDANMGMTAAGWLTQREYTGIDEKAKAFAKDGSFRDDVLSWLPQKADEMTWAALWEAVKREIASRHGNLIGTDAFMQKVAERFDEVVDYTQVYDSVLSRSEVMRSQSALAQMVTSFMAEPTTAYNMLLDSIANRKNKGMKNYVKPGRALGAFAVSVLLNSILKAMVTAGRDDDEKLTYLEKYLRKVSGSIADELNPLGLVPYGRDILSLWEGYDIERADMSLAGDLIDAVKKMSKTDTPIVQRMDVLAGAIGNALGIPYKNVRRDIQGVYNVLANTAPMSRQSVSGAKYSVLEGLPWFDSSRAGYARKLYSAIVNGDAQEEAGLREQISKIVKKDSDINTELRKIITTEFEEERLEPRIALQQMIDLTELKEIKGKIGDWYKTGLITEDVAEQLLVEFTQDDQPNERYKTIEGWDFSKNPDNEGESYSTYKPFYDAIDSGKDLRAVVNAYMDPKKYGASKSTLSSRITDTYKDQYIEAYRRSKTEAAALKARLLNAYVLLGYDRAKKSKDIDAWLKQ